MITLVAWFVAFLSLVPHTSMALLDWLIAGRY
jgi:hypothetical protein